MKKFQAKLKGEDVLVLEVSIDQEKALVVLNSKLKVVPLDQLDLSVSQLFALKLGVRNDIN